MYSGSGTVAAQYSQQPAYTVLNMQRQVAGERHGRHLETMIAHQKSDTICRCPFTSGTILADFILI